MTFGLSLQPTDGNVQGLNMWTLTLKTYKRETRGLFGGWWCYKRKCHMTWQDWVKLISCNPGAPWTVTTTMGSFPMLGKEIYQPHPPCQHLYTHLYLSKWSSTCFTNVINSMRFVSRPYKASKHTKYTPYLSPQYKYQHEYSYPHIQTLANRV